MWRLAASPCAACGGVLVSNLHPVTSNPPSAPPTVPQSSVSTTTDEVTLRRLTSDFQTAHGHDRAFPPSNGERGGVGGGDEGSRGHATTDEAAGTVLPPLFADRPYSSTDPFAPVQTIAYGGIMSALRQLPAMRDGAAPTEAERHRARLAASRVVQRHRLDKVGGSAPMSEAGKPITPSSIRLESPKSFSADLGAPLENPMALGSGAAAADVAKFAPSWRNELDEVIVVAATEVTAADANVPVVYAQLVDVSVAIGALPTPTDLTNDLSELLQSLADAATNAARWDVLKSRLSQPMLARSGAARAPGARILEPGHLTCAAAVLIARTFNFVFQQKRALIELYPRLAAEEKAGFAAAVEQVLPWSFDRNDVLREAALRTDRV